MSAKKKKLSIAPDKFILALSAVLILMISLFNYAFYFTPRQQKVVYAYEEKPQNQQMIVFWQTFLKENPDYLPGWLELAKLEIENNNLGRAVTAANNALRIDPNSERVITILQELDSLD